MSDPRSPPDQVRYLMSGPMTDAMRLDFLENAARKSPTGISFDWVPSVDGEPSGWRFMRKHFVGEQKSTLRAAIDWTARTLKE